MKATLSRAAHPQARRQRPSGQATRGKTAQNRLRRVDNFLARYDPALMGRRSGEFADACFVDLGYGAQPWTTLESAERLRKLNPQLPILGVEIDPERVAAAQPYCAAGIDFRLGGFNLPLRTGPDGSLERVRAIRAFNVLRQYEAEAVPLAWQQLVQNLLPGGLLIEGTSDPYGRIWVANVIRKKEVGSLADRRVDRATQSPISQALNFSPSDQATDANYRLEALVFSTNFRTGFDPGEFQERLPKNLIHQVVPGTAIYDFFAAWKRASLSTASYKALGLRQWFMATALALAEQGYSLDLRRSWLRAGYLILLGGLSGKSSGLFW